MKALGLFGGCLSGGGGGFDCDIVFRKEVGRCSFSYKRSDHIVDQNHQIEHSCDHVPQRVIRRVLMSSRRLNWDVK